MVAQECSPISYTARPQIASKTDIVNDNNIMVVMVTIPTQQVSHANVWALLLSYEYRYFGEPSPKFWRGFFGSPKRMALQNGSSMILESPFY